MNSAGAKVTLDDVRKDWRVLDCDEFHVDHGVRLVSHEDFTNESEYHVEYIKPWKIVEYLKFSKILYCLLYAIVLFKKSDAKSVIIINGGITYLWVWCGILNFLQFFGKRELFCWDIFVEYIHGNGRKLKFFPFIRISTKQKEQFACFIMKQYGLNVVWSKKQVLMHAKHYKLPASKFIFLPFKANHSKQDTFAIPMHNFIFAGGNSKRDYGCLIEAVKGSGIPTIISATDPDVRKTIGLLPNVIVLAAPEPAFAQLQAASRFVVVPLMSGLRGAGEANFCNAMWHARPVIASDSISAEDYIVDGETGFVVPSGDVQQLRKRIFDLWNDENLCVEMGLHGRKHAEAFFTQKKFINRLLRLALLYGSQG